MLSWYYTIGYEIIPPEKPRRKTLVLYDALGNEVARGENVYDEEGRLEVYVYVDENRGDMWMIEYERDEEGRLLAENAYKLTETAHPLPEKRQAMRLEYNEFGKEIVIERFDGNGVVYERIESSYNERGDVSEMRWFNAEGALRERAVHDYDDQGNHVKYTTIDGAGVTQRWETYSYGANGKIIEYNYFDGKGTLTGRCTVEYDADGKKVRDSHFDGQGRLYASEEYEFDDQGNMTKRIDYDENGAVERTHILEYKDGRWIRTTTYDAAGAIQRVSEP